MMSIRKSFVFTLMAGLVALASTASQPVLAASSGCGGPGCTTGNVDLNFQVVIPQMIRLRIGDALTTNTLVFDMSGAAAGTVGDSSPVTGTGGDLLGISRVTVNVRANGGATSVQVDTSVTGGGSGIGCTGSGSCQVGTDFISWDQITVTGNGCTVVPPILDNGGSGFATYNASGGIVNELCAWDYTYDNDTVPVDGTYEGTVSYTANATP